MVDPRKRAENLLRCVVGGKNVLRDSREAIIHVSVQHMSGVSKAVDKHDGETGKKDGQPQKRYMTGNPEHGSGWKSCSSEKVRAAHQVVKREAAAYTSSGVPTCNKRKTHAPLALEAEVGGPKVHVVLRFETLAVGLEVQPRQKKFPA
eukprot:6476808-Amphidinium_carterae.2